MTENGIPGDNKNHPDTIITGSGSTRGGLSVDLISRLEYLYEEMKPALEAAQKDEPSTNEKLLGINHKYAHELEQMDEGDDLDDIIISLWTEIAEAIFGEVPKDMKDSLESNRGKLLDELSEEMVGKSYDETTLEDLVQFVDQNIQSRQDQSDDTPFFHTGFDAYTILTYFATAASVLEQRAAWIIREEIIEDEYKQKEGVWNLINGEDGMNQSQREKWLLRTEIIGNGLHSKMKGFRKMRNKLIHDPHSPIRIPSSASQVEETAEGGLEAARELTDIIDEKLEEQ